MSRTTILLPLLSALALAAAPLAQDEILEDEALRELWDGLSPALRAEAVEYVRFEVRYLENFQTGLVRYLLDTQEVDPGTWPEAEPAPWFEPATHAPAQPIRRSRLSERSSKLRRERERLLGEELPGRLRRAYAYDWTSGELRRVGDPDDPELIFENALLGLPPDTDLAEALLLRMLDDGALRAEHAAFGHAYTDRNGKVYTGITLYDAWCSGLNIEMPDVDVLGIVHELADEWDRWVAPVPPTQDDALYGQVGDWFVSARRHRSLREAVARVYVRGSGLPADQWSESTDRLHALWELHSSTPARLAEALPEPSDFEPFLENLAERCVLEPEVLRAGEVRRATLDQGRWQMRYVLQRVLRELAQSDNDG